MADDLHDDHVDAVGDAAVAFVERTYGRAGGVDLAHDPPAAPHLLVRASAGTGKTYRLTTRYLRLLHAGETPEHILATTFTRKAAGEVMARVLGWLAGAAVDAGERAALDHALGGFGLSEQDCLAMLRRLVDAMHRLGIGTIDSFFNRSARALRFELDLPADPVIADASGPLARALRLDAIQQSLGEAAATEDGFQTLIELLRRMHHDTAKRSVTEALDGLVAGLYDVYRQHREARLWSKLNPAKPLTTDMLDALAVGVVALGEHIPQTQGGSPRKAWVKAYEQINAAVQQRDFDTLLAHLIGQRLLDDDQPAAFGGCDIPDVWRDALMPLIAHARAQTLRQLAEMTESTYRLLDGFASHYESAKRAAGVLMFSDLTDRLSSYLPSLGEAATAEFYYRLDTRVTHLLLDEFQDTSEPQWRVLAPFAEEATAASDGERSFFCVGDEKQAIYGWRGGCAELFQAVEALPGVTPWTMTHSRRSSQVVLDAVNQVFSTLSHNVALEDKDKNGRWDTVVGRWTERFEPHTAHHREMPGHVLLTTTAPRTEGETEPVDDELDEQGASATPATGATPHEAFCAEHIAALVSGSPGSSVGVLVRRRAAAGGLLYRLREMGVPVSEEGGHRIDHTPAVSAVLSAVWLADHPGDRAAAFHVVNSPLGEALGLRDTRPEAVAPLALRVRRALLDRGFGETIAGWCEAVAPACGVRSLRRLEQLVTLAQRYDRDTAALGAGGALPGVLRVGEFVDMARQARVQSPTPAAVRVMTLHAAKGLEFDTVVLPDLDASLSQNDSKALVMLDRDGPLDPPRAVVRRIDRKKLAAVGLEQLADREDALQRAEDLCLLYVGMTRAKHALHLLVRPLTEGKKGGTGTGKPTAAGLTNLSYAAILRQALRLDEAEGFEGGQTLYESGDSGCLAGGDASAAESAEDDSPAPRPGLRLVAGSTQRRGRPERRPSDGAEDATVRADDLLKRTDPAGRSYGSAMHAVCELLGFADEDTPPRAAEIAEALANVGLTADGETVSAFVGRLASLLAARPVYNALSRAGAAELWRERPFAAVVGGRLLQGVFDRVHVWRDDTGQATRARLIDFKTDKPPAPDDGGFDALAEHYRPQLAAYRDALMALLKLEPGAIETMLILTGEAAVVPVDLSQL